MFRRVPCDIARSQICTKAQYTGPCSRCLPEHTAISIMAVFNAADCMRDAPPTPEYLPSPASLHVPCPSWHEVDAGDRPCATIDHLRAGYGSYIHHAIHGVFLARGKGHRLVPLLHHYVRKEAIHHRVTEVPMVRQAFSIDRRARWNGTNASVGPCQLALLGCVTGVAESSCDFRHAPRMDMSGQARRRHSLFQVGAAALALLRPDLSPLASPTAHLRLGGPCIAAQLRFGDSCGTNAFHTGRRCGPVQEYVDAVVKLRDRYGITRVVAASDSARSLAEFTSLLGARGMHVTTLTPPERLQGDAILRERKMVEHVMVRNATLAWAMLETFLVDLYGLSQSCDALVTKFTSNMGRLLLELIAARLGRVPPYVSLDVPWCFGNRAASPHGQGYFPC